ncbi:SigE family RNA polymerase sigma factor [Catellatospora citrea]|uniref:DNA-directed RNA polymerase sigma-70 factor n=1 Tax=Catellatospora citrea TaxID=53366 RepID=A0A8J3KE36_9ACTN|nr:SigE family RNA polymerase sigma factor [Catellatospora citrea]RKE08874.1 RNA polymerase sigma-70 factor (sigma-E family) [Catellatospora citrea]GIG01253.1 DNA-directed RNA polymerase sigma-70 factor [Catellatospora citrea]
MDASRAEEFEAFVRGRTPALLRAAYLLTGDQHLAEDLVNDALIRTHQVWHRLRDSSPEAYTRKIMYHLQISWWRRRKRSPERLTDLPPEPGAGLRHAVDEQARAVTRLALQDALGHLGARQRAVLVLRYFEDRTESEVAELLGVTVGTVKSQSSKALARLRTVAPHLLDSPISDRKLR